MVTVFFTVTRGQTRFEMSFHKANLLETACDKTTLIAINVRSKTWFFSSLLFVNPCDFDKKLPEKEGDLHVHNAVYRIIRYEIFVFWYTENYVTHFKKNITENCPLVTIRQTHFLLWLEARQGWNLFPQGPILLETAWDKTYFNCYQCEVIFFLNL